MLPCELILTTCSVTKSKSVSTVLSGRPVLCSVGIVAQKSLTRCCVVHIFTIFSGIFEEERFGLHKKIQNEIKKSPLIFIQNLFANPTSSDHLHICSYRYSYRSTYSAVQWQNHVSPKYQFFSRVVFRKILVFFDVLFRNGIFFYSHT